MSPFFQQVVAGSLVGWLLGFQPTEPVLGIFLLPQDCLKLTLSCLDTTGIPSSCGLDEGMVDSKGI